MAKEPKGRTSTVYHPEESKVLTPSVKEYYSEENIYVYICINVYILGNQDKETSWYWFCPHKRTKSVPFRTFHYKEYDKKGEVHPVSLLDIQPSYPLTTDWGRDLWMSSPLSLTTRRNRSLLRRANHPNQTWDSNNLVLSTTHRDTWFTPCVSSLARTSGKFRTSSSVDPTPTFYLTLRMPPSFKPPPESFRSLWTNTPPGSSSPWILFYFRGCSISRPNCNRSKPFLLR